MNEEKSLREEIADVKKMVKAIAVKLNDIVNAMRKQLSEEQLLRQLKFS